MLHDTIERCCIFTNRDAASLVERRCILLHKNFRYSKNSLEIQIKVLSLHKQTYYRTPNLFIMRIISRSTLVEYYTKNPQAKVPLEDWYEKTKKAEWTCFADIKETFNTVSIVGNKHYVFNIKGNDYRLVVVILFTPQRVYIRFVGTHAEYDKITNIQNI